jgi:hypothetical protein
MKLQFFCVSQVRDAEGEKPVSRDESFEYANEILVRQQSLPFNCSQ